MRADLIFIASLMCLRRNAEPAGQVATFDQVQTLEVHGIVHRKLSPDELRSFVRRESEKFGKIIETAKITLGN